MGGGSAQPAQTPTVVSGADIAPNFSQKNVNSSITEEYEHNLTTIQPSEMDLEKAEAAKQAAIAEEEAAKEKAKKDAEKLKRKGSKMSSTSQLEEEQAPEEEQEGEDRSKKGSEKDEHEEVDEDDEEYMFRVFFKRDEIRMAGEMQRKDQFEELVQMKVAATQEN